MSEPIIQDGGTEAPQLFEAKREHLYQIEIFYCILLEGPRSKTGVRAAKIAGLKNVPVRIIQLTDAEAVEAQCVENLHREDIHPLEEALGFKSLLELGAPYNIAHIAARSGKSEAYIYGLCF